ncbi:hypothetical protein EV363DRAFT_1081155, partial [Boletus edulis]
LMQEQMSKPEGTQQSIRKICSTVQERWQAKPGYKDIRVSRDTVQRRMDNGSTRHQNNMETKSWLSEQEEDRVVKFCLEYAARGFPLKHNSLKLYVDSI